MQSYFFFKANFLLKFLPIGDFCIFTKVGISGMYILNGCSNRCGFGNGRQVFPFIENWFTIVDIWKEKREAKIITPAISRKKRKLLFFICMKKIIIFFFEIDSIVVFFTYNSNFNRGRISRSRFKLIRIRDLNGESDHVGGNVI